jgi:hypothetical protein
LVDKRDEHAPPAVRGTEGDMRAGAILTVTPYVGVVGEDLLDLGERDAVAGQMDFVAIVDLDFGYPHDLSSAV